MSDCGQTEGFCLHLVSESNTPSDAFRSQESLAGVSSACVAVGCACQAGTT